MLLSSGFIRENPENANKQTPLTHGSNIL